MVAYGKCKCGLTPYKLQGRGSYRVNASVGSLWMACTYNTSETYAKGVREQDGKSDSERS